MDAGGPRTLISVKRRLLRHPALIAAAAAVIGTLLFANVVAFMRGMDAPWLLAIALVADMLVIGAGSIVAAREVLVAEQRTEASQARLGAIVDSAMDAIITTDEAQNIVLFNRAAEQLFGVRREEMIGTGLDRLIPGRFRGAHRGHIDEFGRTGVTSRRMGDVTTLWALRPSTEG